MQEMKIAATEEARLHFETSRFVVDAVSTDFVDVAAVVAMVTDKEIIAAANATKFGIPVFVFTDKSVEDADLMKQVSGILDMNNEYDQILNNRKIEAAAQKYEENVLPPFFGTLKSYVERGNLQFDCPGHQGGQYYRKHPAGRAFYDFFGENAFRSDICNADVALGDLLIHEGPAMDAEKHAAKVFNADKTYFVINGTTTSNNITIAASVRRNDLVLFDRNNHKSNYTAALIKQGGIPVYLETSRDP